MQLAFSHHKVLIGAVAAVVVLAIAAVVLLSMNSSGASANHAGTPDVVMGFDMDPSNVGPPNEGPEDGVNQTCNDTIDNGGGDGADGADAGGDCTGLGNTSTTLGPIDACIPVSSAGPAFDFDVFMDGVPNGKNLAGFDYIIQFPEAAGATLTAGAHATPGTTIIQSDFSFSDPFPDPPGDTVADGRHLTSEADLTATVAAPSSTVGVMGRYTLDPTGMAAGTYALGIEPASIALGSTTAGEDNAPLITDILDKNGPGVDGFPSAGVFGLFVVDGACPTPADLKAVSVDVSALSGAIVPLSTDFDFPVIEELHNNGPNPSVPTVVMNSIEATEDGAGFGSCFDGIDNGGDTVADAADPDCAVEVSWDVLPADEPIATEVQIDTDGDGTYDTTVAGPFTAGTSFAGFRIKVTWLITLPNSSTVFMNEQFDVHCLAPSFHTIIKVKEVEAEDPFTTDPNTLNNSTSSTATFSCLAEADLKVVSQNVTIVDPDGPPLIGDDGFDNDNDASTDEDGVGDCDADGDPDDDSDGSDDEDGGDCFTVEVDKVIHNNGPWEPTPAFLSKTVVVTDPNSIPIAGCVVTLDAAASDSPLVLLDFSMATPHHEEFVIDCPQVGYGVDDDGDSLDGRNFVDEDPPGDGNGDGSPGIFGVDDDGDGGTDLADVEVAFSLFFVPGYVPADDDDEDGLVDEDGPVSIEAVTVVNVIVPAEPNNHIQDPDFDPFTCDPFTNPAACGDNFDVDTVIAIDQLPFNPTHQVFQDEVDADMLTNPSPSIDCLITLPCKMQWAYSIPGGNPLAQAVQDIPIGPYTLTRAPGYDRVAQFTGLATIDPGIGSCVVSLPFTIPLDNAALPAAGGGNDATLLAVAPGYVTQPALPFQLADDVTDTVDSDGDGPVDEDPPDFLGGGGISTDQDGDTRIDEDDSNAIVNPLSWSKHLDAEVIATNAVVPTAKLIARYTGFVIVVGTPVAVNVLVFDDSAGSGTYLLKPVLGDTDGDGDFLISAIDPDDDNDGLPDFSDTDDDNDGVGDPLETAQCSPLTVNFIHLGETIDSPVTPFTEGGNTVLVCNIINTAPGFPISGSFTRADIGTTTTLFSNVTCSGDNDISQELAKDEDVGDGVDAGYGVDDDGDTAVDEDAVDSVDNDGDSSVDEDDAGDPNGLAVGQTQGVEVDVIITNGNVPSAINEELSIVSKDPCVAEWDPGSLGGDGSQTNVVLDPLITVGPTHISVLNWTEGGDTPPQMNTFESVTVTAKYLITCSAPGSQQLQIESHVESTPTLPDSNPLDNEAQNNPTVNYSNADIDGDGEPNASDNCAFTANASQTNTDGDALGDACDHDDDGDGFDDAVDACPLLPEDPGNPQDGCPETDMSINVVKDNPIDVDVSQDTNFTVTATATNGDYGLFNGNGVIFFELLKSNVTDPNDQCVADWIAQPGDLKVTDTVVEEFDGVPGQTLFISQLQTTISPLPPFNSVDKVRDYTLHCNARSDHKIFLEEGIAPTAPIQDPNVNNNVHKQYINIEAWDLADVKIVSHDIHDVTGPTGTAADTDGDSVVDANVETIVVVKKVLHNNGPTASADVTLTSNASVPTDCSATLTDATAGYPDFTLPASTQVTVFETWTVVCDQPSDHTFSFDNSVDTNEVHLRDPDDTNNSGSSSTTVAILGATDLDLTVSNNAPLTGQVSQDETFEVTTTIDNDGSFDAQPNVSQTLSAVGLNAADCTVSFHVTAPFLAGIVGGGQGLSISADGSPVSPPTGAGWEPSDRVVSAAGGSITIDYATDVASHDSTVLVNEWDKHCTAPSFHDFQIVTDVTDGGNVLHVSHDEPSDTQGFEEAIFADADLKISDWFFLDDVSQLDADSWFREVPLSPASLDDYDIDSKEKLHNNGPYGPVDGLVSIDATPSTGCNVSYEVSGNESDILIDAVSQLPASAGDVIGPVSSGSVLTVEIPVNLPVSVDVFLAERFGLGVDDHTTKECTVDLDKSLDEVDAHVNDPNGAAASRDFTVCLDTDGDGVADSCLTNGEKDNCTDVSNPGQEDSDGDGLGDACDARAVHDLGVKFCIKLGPAPVNLSSNQGHYMWALCEIGNFSDHDEAVEISMTLGALPDGCGSSAPLDGTLNPVMILPGQSTILLQGQFVDNDGDTAINEDPPDGVDNDGDSQTDEDGPDGEQKIILFRTRFECHDPATAQLVSLPVEICVDHGDHTDQLDDDNDGTPDEDPVDGADNDGDSLVDEDPPEADGDKECDSQVEQVIIDDPTP